MTAENGVGFFRDKSPNMKNVSEEVGQKKIFGVMFSSALSHSEKHLAVNPDKYLLSISKMCLIMFPYNNSYTEQNLTQNR